VNLADREIASRAGRGDSAAFVQFVERYRAPLISYAYGLTGRRDDAEELAQEAFCRVWEKLPTLRQPDRIVSWLYRIAHNLAVSATRRPQGAPLPAEAVAVADSRPDPGADVHRAVGSLPEPQRLVVSLRHFTGLSHEEIARTLNVPAGTVRSRLSRAYERLRPLLAHLMED
jgi:RNA polymerase sigma-70 factor (ECF subfamily)